MSTVAGAEPFEFDVAEAPAGVVLCHGFTGSPASMRPWGEYLREKGLSVACPLLPGHGTAWPDLNRTTWRDWYAALAAEFDTMRVRLGERPVFAMGLSMGGTLVTRLAQERGAQLAGLVLVNPSYMTLRFDARFLPLVSRLVPSVAGVSNDISKPGMDERAYSRTPLKAANSLRQLWKVVRGDLGRVAQPLLVLHSPQDHVVEPENTRLLLRGVSSTDVAEVELPRSFHVATLDHDAEVIFSRSLKFVTNHLPTDRTRGA